MKKIFKLVSILFLIMLTTTSCSKENKGKQKASSITAAGATFPLPYYNKIFKTYSKKSEKILVTYGGIGSGGGIRSLKNKIVDFGATDAFLTDKKLKDMPAEILHIPTCIGAVVIAYNLPNHASLKLTPEILTAIFLGKIKNWNDPLIQAVNKEVKLPDLPVLVVHRSDGSGTTKIFSDYLAKVSAEWQENIGSGKSLKWPVGIGAKGNPGVAGNVKQTEGAIGYLGYEFAKSQNLPVAIMQNKQGNFIKPSIEAITAAASKEIPSDTRIYITNTDAENGYPIAGFTWIILYKEQNYNSRSYDQALQTLKLLDWILEKKSQDIAQKVNFAPLPKSLVVKAKSILRNATYNGKKLLK